MSAMVCFNARLMNSFRELEENIENFRIVCISVRDSIRILAECKSVVSPLQHAS